MEVSKQETRFGKAPEERRIPQPTTMRSEWRLKGAPLPRIVHCHRIKAPQFRKRCDPQLIRSCKRGPGRRRPFGTWLLELFWDLELGIWSFSRGRCGL